MTYPIGGHWAARVVTAGDPDDVLTVAELLERARIVAGDEESSTLVQSYIAAAIAQVELDTGLALTTQTILATFDTPGPSGVLRLPRPPCQDVTAITYVDGNGDTVALDLDAVLLWLDTVSMPARLALSGAPAAALSVSITAGWTKATLPATLKLAVGLLAAHYLTAGRDRVVIGTSVLDMPAGYDEAIAVHRLEVVV